MVQCDMIGQMEHVTRNAGHNHLNWTRYNRASLLCSNNVIKRTFEHTELPAKLPDYFFRSNKSNINHYGGKKITVKKKNSTHDKDLAIKIFAWRITLRKSQFDKKRVLFFRIDFWLNILLCLIYLNQEIETHVWKRWSRNMEKSMGPVHGCGELWSRNRIPG